MDRKKFITWLSLTPLAGIAMKLSDLNGLKDSLPKTERMPVLFLGHGSPMNAIEENQFVTGFRQIAKRLPMPRAILCVSAHWETAGTFVTAMKMPRTIHDFGGFPQRLFDVQYPAPGSPELAAEAKHLIKQTSVGLDEHWGLDHGAWSVIKHLYPDADVPVVQLSLDYQKQPAYHYELAKNISELRNRGVLIVGSGNMVHNLGLVDWKRLNEAGFAFEWATEANEKMKQFILSGDHQQLINYQKHGRAFQLAIPSAEHYLPLLYTLALQDKNESLLFFNDQAVAGALTMTSVFIGGSN